MQHSTQTLRSELIRAAQALDEGQDEQAQIILGNVPPLAGDVVSRRLVVSLWRRLFVMRRQKSGDGASVHVAIQLLSYCEKAISGGNPWLTLKLLPEAEKRLGAPLLAQILNSVLWDMLPKAPYGFQYEILTRCFLGGEGRSLVSLWTHLLRYDTTFVPDYWHFQSLAKSWSENGVTDIEASTSALLARAGRTDLDDLFGIYLTFLRQKDMRNGLERSKSLIDAAQRERIADYLLGASQRDELLPLIVEIHDVLADPDNETHRQFMQARLAVSQGKWSEVERLTADLTNDLRVKHEATCLRALALSHLNRHEDARNAVDFIRKGDVAPWFLVGRASLINLTRRLLQDGVPLQNDLPSPNLTPLSGKPLAQSLWIGPRLRWIEELSIRSFLANGWRYQLYVYEPPENTPDGVELMDASAILPRDAIFRESASSGMHKGSVGAFSDLFRYALLNKRGGMWTDTDVLNLDLFEPSGQRFVSTEYTDAGLIGVNGAMMAAPSGDIVQQTALRRAENLLERTEMHFARIGPELLAELLGDDGLQGYRLMPTDFLNPVGWMETGKLLAPFEAVSSQPWMTTARNIHVYTETWRLIGLSLAAAPRDGGFLSTIYDRLMNAAPLGAEPVRSLLRG